MKKSRLLLWLILLAVSGTGIALHLMAPATEDELPHQLNGLFRSLHGAVSMFAIFIFGYFFSDHVQKKLAKYRNRGWAPVWDGYSHLTAWVALIISGILLYYPQEVLTALSINVVSLHWYAGLLLMIIFPLHFWRKTIMNHHLRKQ
jgi:hypothetical protein